MKFLRRSVALLLCAMMPFTMTGMMPASGAIKTVTYAQDEIDGGISLFATGDMVTLNAGEGTVDITSVALGEGDVLPELPVPTRTGWVFVGWYTKEVKENFWGDNEGETLEGLKTAYPGQSDDWYKQTTFTWIIESEGEKVVEGDQLPDNVTTLYAMYEPTTVDVVWHYNGWLNEPVEKEILRHVGKQYGSSLASYELAMLKEWEGREFLGWYDANGNEWTFHKVNDYEMSDQVVTGELHLYAHWTGGPEAETLRLSPMTSHVEPGSEFQITASYSPLSANRPTVKWDSDSDLVEIVPVDGLTATVKVSKEANVVDGNKQVTITAQTEAGVVATATVTICHAWNYGKTIQEATCTEGGIVRYTCTECGEIRDVSHPANGHRFTNTEKPATCTEEGYTDRYCVVCGLTERVSTEEALGHSWSVQTIHSCTGTVTTSTCTTCGLAEVSSDVNDVAHDWETTPTVDKAPTCLTEGSQSYHCSNCALTKDSSVIAPLGHKWSDWKVTKEATETETGEETRVCASCGTGELIVIPKLPTIDITPVLDETVVDKDVENTLKNAVKKILATSADKDLVDAINAAVDLEKTITAEVVVTPVEAPADTSKFESLLKGANIQYVDIEIVVKADGRDLVKITETDDPITFSFLLSKEESGRIIQVLREHEGVVEVIPCKVDGNMVYFSTNKFSTFAVGSTNDISFASVDAIANQTYTGSEIKPTVKVMINGGETLVEGVDYTVSYKNNISAGTATVVITGIGDFAGSTKEITFSIVETDNKKDSNIDSGASSNAGSTTDSGTGSTTDSNVGSGPSTEAGNSTSPKTGDETNLAFWVLMLALSGCGLSLTAMRKKKINR